MNNPRMLYRSPGPHTVDGITYDYLIVPEDDAREAVAAGWSYTVAEAAERRAVREQAANADAGDEQPPAPVDEVSPPTRDELIQRAEQLGLVIDKRWGNARIAEAIAAQQAQP